MINWLADLLLNIGGVFTRWIFGNDLPGSRYQVLAMMFATLVLAAVVVAIAYWQSLVTLWESRWKPRK